MTSQINPRPFRPVTNGPPATSSQVNPNNNQAKPPNLFPNPQGQPQMGMLNPQAANPFNGPNISMQQQNGPQQVNLNNNQAKSPNLFPTPQVQPQMGMINPQAANSFNGPNIPMQQQNGPLNAQQVPPNFHGNQQNLIPNHQMQSQMGMLNPQMQMLNPQTQMLNPQTQMLFNNNNFSTPMLVPMLVNPQNGFMVQMNTNQPFNQLFAPNFMNNFPMNQNTGFPMQNMNQFVQRPVFPNQFPQVMGPQNPNFVQNTQFGMVPNNMPMLPNGQTSSNLVNNGAQVAQGNTMGQLNLHLLPPQQAQNSVRPPVPNVSQGNHTKDNGMTSPQGKWKNHQNPKFTVNNKRHGLQKGFQKNNHMKNGKAMVRSNFKQEVKGYQGQAGQNPNFASSLNETPVRSKKNLSLNYTEHEIRQWREERKKNFPSSANLQKKQGENLARSEENERIAKLRQEQLKDILEKQAKLGCEVAEIPSHYLYDSEKQPNGKEDNTKAFGRREKFQKNKFNKKGRSRQNDRFGKKQKSGDNESDNMHKQNEQPPPNKREPTLLQKLLGADIRRDKARLLQVFRFFVMNSFLKGYPQTPLSFPLVMVKEGEVVEQKPILENGISDIKDREVLTESNGVDGNDSADDEDDHVDDNRSRVVLDNKAALSSSFNCIVKVDKGNEEEEGEICE